jgi:hypothetical protein
VIFRLHIPAQVLDSILQLQQLRANFPDTLLNTASLLTEYCHHTNDMVPATTRAPPASTDKNAGTSTLSFSSVAIRSS